MSGLSKTRLAVLVGGVIAVVGIVIAVVVASGSKDRTGDATSGGTVKIELRGNPTGKLRMNGKAIGKTPTTIIVPRGTKPLELDATFEIEKVGLKRPAKKVETWRQGKSVVPDHDQTVDFTVKDAAQIGESVDDGTR